MTAPWLPEAASVAALPVGIAFGAALERAGLGSARTIADQLRARDFTVIKVMFSAIVTAMLGVFWASRLGWLDLSRVAIPETDLVPQLIGAGLFGAGFAIASLCPGTACVAAGAGLRDGLMVIGGLFIGTLVVMVAWPALGPIAERAPHDASLAGDLGLPAGVMVAAISLMGVAVLAIVGRVERRSEESGDGSAPRTPLLPRAVSAPAAIALALGGLAIFVPDGRPVAGGGLAAIGGEIAAERDHVDPIELAEWIRARKPGLRVIDVREGADSGGYQIPRSETVPLDALAALPVAAGETLVLYSDGGTHAAQGWVLLRARGVAGVFLLRDGLAAWEDEVMNPHPPLGADSAGQERYRRARELSLWFGGTPSSTPRPVMLIRPSGRSRRNTC